jgi:carbamoyltransferase
MSNQSIYVLGTGLSHDGSACLLKDGRVCVAIEKERLTRNKHDGGNDSLAIQYCLDAEGITLSDVSLIVQNANFGMFERGSSWFRGKRLIQDGMPVVTISHHLAHAYSAFGMSPFEEAAVLVIDGCGNGLDECMDLDGAIIPESPAKEIAHLYFEKDSYYSFQKRGHRSIYKDFSPMGMNLKSYPLYPNSTLHSIGGLYTAASVYVFNSIDDSGKLMGLAPYGRPGEHDFDIFELRDGRVFVRYEWMERFNRPAHSPDDLNANFQHYADLAYWVQREVERALLYLIRRRYEMFSSENLCYSGGVALNAVANHRILKEGPFKHLFIQPAAGDNGLALGCAYYGWLECLKREKVPHNRSSRFGKVYCSKIIESALANYASSISVDYSENIIEKTADCLVGGEVVGWFHEQSEFGPRALGSRSILADPRRTIKEHINSKIKFREDFRPFAPSVLAEDARLYFDCDYESPYMLLVAPVRKEWKDVIPSVVHRDGTARLQTVSESDYPLYYRLLRAFKDRTGIGVLLNTSFNKRRMPIVETPDHAIAFFLACGLDMLVIGNYLVHKKQVSHAAENLSDLFAVKFSNLLVQKHAHASRLGGIYHLNIDSVRQWTIDLSSEPPRIAEGITSAQPDAVLYATEAEFRLLLNAPQEALRLINSGTVRLVGDSRKVVELSYLLREA